MLVQFLGYNHNHEGDLIMLSMKLVEFLVNVWREKLGAYAWVNKSCLSERNMNIWVKFYIEIWMEK